MLGSALLALFIWVDRGMSTAERDVAAYGQYTCLEDENLASRVVQKRKSTVISDAMGVTHFTTRGHDGPINCVAASPGLDYIVTGGVDGTMRVWYYDSLLGKCYRLKICVEHGVSVEAVDMVGDTSVAISATHYGGLYVTDCESRRIIGDPNFHEDSINDTSVFEESDESFLIFSCSEDMTAKMVRFKKTEQEFSKVLVLEHKSSVYEVRYLQEASLPLGGIATCTEEGVSIWSLEGQLVMTARMPPVSEPTPITRASTENSLGSAEARADLKHPNTQGMAVAADGKMILSSSDDDRVCVWGLKGCRFVTGKAEEPPETEDELLPLATYDVPKVKYIELDPTDSWVVDVRDECRAVVWVLKPEEEADSSRETVLGMMAGRKSIAVGKGSITKSIVMPGDESIKASLVHDAEVVDMRMIDDPDDGPALLTGCSDGVAYLWDLSGNDVGEMYAQLRSLHKREIFIPMLTLLVTFVQVSSFAFGPSIPWKNEVHAPASKVVQFSMCDIDLEISKETVFWYKTVSVVIFMTLFILSAITSFPGLLATMTFNIQVTDRFKDEMDYKYPRCGPMHLLVTFIQFNRSVILLFIQLASSVLVVPVSKALAEAVDCNHPEDDLPYLDKAPTITCFEGDHYKMAVVLAIIVPVYFFLLIPFAVVQGDQDYIQASELLRPTAWMFNAERKACLVFLGPVHPSGKYAFTTLLIDLLSKMALPIMAIETTHKPMLQMILLTTVSTVRLIYSTILSTPYVNKSFCTVFRGSILFTFLAMCCGCFTVILDDKDRIEPSIVFGCCAAIVPLTTLIVAYKQMQPDKEAKAHHLFVDNAQISSLESTNGESARTASASARKQRAADSGREMQIQRTRGDAAHGACICCAGLEC